MSVERAHPLESIVAIPDAPSSYRPRAARRPRRSGCCAGLLKVLCLPLLAVAAFVVLAARGEVRIFRDFARRIYETVHDSPALYGPGTLTGFVRSSADEPAAGAQARLTLARSGDPQGSGLKSWEAVCDDGGRFEFEGLPRAYFVLEIHAPAAGGEAHLVHMSRLRAIDEAQELQITLPELGSVEGALLWSDGRGRPGIDIQLTSHLCDVQATLGSTTTDAEGAFRFEGVLPGHFGLVVGIDHSTYPERWAVDVEPGRASPVALDFREPRIVAEVVVLDQDGVPLARQRIRGHNRGFEDPLLEWRTDAAGRVSIPALRRGTAEFWVWDEARGCAASFEAELDERALQAIEVRLPGQTLEVVPAPREHRPWTFRLFDVALEPQLGTPRFKPPLRDGVVSPGQAMSIHFLPAGRYVLLAAPFRFDLQIETREDLERLVAEGNAVEIPVDLSSESLQHRVELNLAGASSPR